MIMMFIKTDQKQFMEKNQHKNKNRKRPRNKNGNKVKKANNTE